MGNDGQLMKNLKGYKQSAPSNFHQSDPFRTGVTQVLSDLARIGITGMHAVDRAKLFPLRSDGTCAQ